MKDILIVGKSGLLGTKLHERLINKHRVGGVSKSGAGTNNQVLDITNRVAVSHFFNTHSIDVVIHVAAITDVDYCERHQTDAWETNVEGTKNLIMECKKHDVCFYYISSDYIFSGSNPPYAADANPDPINYYGVTKLEAERIIKEELSNFTIVRPGKLYGYSSEFGCDPFTKWVRDSLAEEDMVKVDNSVMKYPTLIDDVTRFIENTIGSGENRIFNFSSQDGITKYKWAQLIAERYGFDTASLQKTINDSYADRPKNVQYAQEDLKVSPYDLESGIEVMHKQEFCSFRPIYRMDISDEFLGQSSGKIRKQLGKTLALTDNIKPDVVVPIPKSGIYPAVGYAEEINSPLEFALSKQQLRKRTLYDQGIDREKVLEEKMCSIDSIIKNKTIALVDEAILSGKTLQTVVPKMSSADEIHVRISSPPISKNCPAHMHPGNSDLLSDEINLTDSYKDVSVENQIAAELDVSSVRYIDKASYLSEMGAKHDSMCSVCFHS